MSITCVLLGVTLMGMCILGFYVSVKARGAVDSHLVAPLTTTTTPPPPTTAAWRIGPSGASCLAFVNDTSCPKDFSPPPLVVLGLDGLRPDALREEVTPALLYLRRCGATMHSLVPTYPTTTFPNLYTIATGLYPESHGIVGNRMHDPAIAKDFHPERPRDHGQGGLGRKSGILYWPGSDVSIQGSYPPYWKSYVTNLTSEQRITQVHEWLMLPEQERPQLIMVYFEEPMRTMQQYGMDSKEATEGLANMDRTVDELMNYLHQHKLAHCVNVMVVSDHGVIPFSCSNNFHLETFMPEIEKEVHVFTGAVGRLRSKSNKKHEEEILNSLRCKNPKVRALPKDLLPRRYHYANNNRIENVLLDTRSNTRVVTNSERICRKAEHGYNNLEAEMQATFIGFGPDFKVNATTQSFRNVELYN
ncbi:Ectonucleotide pyrophosphatase/phosphodiesterase family member 1 [Chionoecetes opilio]|uniref:Ectonucleotide pyrophosphatase/phosphodiesterase family member 1 n=1 Tax=Chionoecetes opilio TaxID=41210 RepID=A0A8J5CVT2_CHIOP|nr:Ectonucleotide pyrophosphatase/phosphodiesterase family member 1 [Chionoecetes opilio]